MLRKSTLLVMAVGALIAFAAPASASADVWTDNDVALEAAQTANQSFEGFLKVTAGAAGSFGCEVTVEIEAEGLSWGRVTKFNPTTEECIGTGPAFTGCTLKEDFNNIASVFWNIDVSSTPIKVAAVVGNMTIRFGYEKCKSGITGSHLEFASFSLTPALNGAGTITAFTVQGTSTTGVPLEGSLFPEDDVLTLGLQN